MSSSLGEANTSTSTPYANTYAAQPQTNAGVNTTTQQGVTQNYGETTTTTQAQTTYGATTTQAQSDYGATTTQAQSNYGADAQYAMGENTLTDADLQQVALDAGMPGVPMSAAEVCAPRDVSLAQNTSRLNRDARRQLINATDHASVCDIQQVTIKAPDGRGEAVRQTLVAQGVDDAMISVEDSDGELGVEMAFSGVATSSEYYAQMFNQPQFAANTAAPAGASQYDPATGQYAPSTATPETADPYASPSSTSSDYRETAADAYEAQPSAQPISYQPEPVGAPIE